MRGAFVVIDGVDGSGKTTQVKRLEKELKEIGREVIVLRDPGGTAAGEMLRTVLKDPQYPLCTKAQFLIFLASRTQLYHEIIRPAVDSGYLVLADRFYLSTAVYQGVVGGIGVDRVKEWSDFCLDGLTPDLHVFLSCPVDIALNRRSPEEQRDRFESKGCEFLSNVVAAYEETAKRYNCTEIDGTNEIDKVSQQIKSRVLHTLSVIDSKADDVKKALNGANRVRSSW